MRQIILWIGASAFVCLTPLLADNPRAKARAMAIEGFQACAAGETAECRTLLLKAEVQWPNHCQIQQGLAAAEATLDPDSSFRRVKALLESGLQVNLDDEDFAPLRQRGDFSVLEHSREALKKPVGTNQVRFRLKNKTLMPEAVAWDPLSGDYFVTGIHGQQVIRQSKEGKETVFATLSAAGLGLALDSARRRLWVTTKRIPQMKSWVEGMDPGSTLEVYDIDSGHRLDQIEGEGRGLGDLTVGASGSVYVSGEGPNAKVYRYDPTHRKWATLVSEDLVRSPQGVAVNPDESLLFVADYSYGLLKVNLNSGESAFMELPNDLCFVGVDGLNLFGNNLFAVQNGLRPQRILHLHLTQGLDRVDDWSVVQQGLELFDEPTNGTIANGSYLYVANSQWNLIDPQGDFKDQSLLRPPAILEIPLVRSADEP